MQKEILEFSPYVILYSPTSLTELLVIDVEEILESALTGRELGAESYLSSSMASFSRILNKFKVIEALSSCAGLDPTFE